MVYETEKNAFYGKDPTRKPECPFCGLPIGRPAELQTRRYGEMPVGSCSCGAVYACDVTGHNLGAAFIEALVFGCDMDWDLAWSLTAKDDYTEKLVENYDPLGHLIVPGGVYEGRRAGALYFVRLHRDIRDLTGQGIEQKLEKARAVPSPPPSDPDTTDQRTFSKREVEELVKEYAVDRLVGAGRNRRTLRHLQRLLYSGDELVRARAADILGKSSAKMARTDPGPVSGLLQELFSSVAAPGASSWGSLDAIGEIIGGSPDLFAGYLPMLYNFLEDPDYRPRVVRAIYRTAADRPDLVRKATFRLLPFLRDPDPEARGYAALLFGSLGAPEARKDLEAIRDDAAEIKVYKNGALESKTVGQMAGEALENIAAGEPGS